MFKQDLSYTSKLQCNVQMDFKNIHFLIDCNYNKQGM